MTRVTLWLVHVACWRQHDVSITVPSWQVGCSWRQHDVSMTSSTSSIPIGGARGSWVTDMWVQPKSTASERSMGQGHWRVGPRLLTSAADVIVTSAWCHLSCVATDRWVPRDVITTSAWRHPPTCGSWGFVTLTCEFRSTVNVDRSTVNMGRVSNGLWRERGRARCAGPARGPRACAGKTGRGGWQAGWAGWLARAEQAEPAMGLLSFFIFFCFIFFSFVWFQIWFEIWIPNWCTIFIGVLDMRPTTYLYKY